MRYEIVAEAYRDLEQASGRLALVDRLAALLAQTPAELLPVVCYLCQGLIAPEFAGVDLGLAEKLAVRAVATATGVETGQVTALVRETGDLGQATPLEARYLLRLVTKGLRLGIGTPTILDALAQVYTGGRAARPVLERA